MKYLSPHSDNLRIADFSEYYAPDYELDVRPSNMDNANSQEYLQKIKIQVIENLKRTTFAPSVQMTDVPRDPVGYDDEADAELDDLDQDENPDSRFTKRQWDKYVEKEGELSDSEDEEMNGENGVRKQPNAPKRRRNIMDFQNDNAAPDDDINGEVVSGVVSAGSGRSPNGADGANGSHMNDSEVEPIEGDNDDLVSSPARDAEDEDVEMADETARAPRSTSKHAQEATPPESPPEVDTAVTVPAVSDTVNEAPEEAMAEGDTLDDPEMAKEAGQDEREKEDIAAEKATEVEERAET